MRPALKHWSGRKTVSDILRPKRIGPRRSNGTRAETLTLTPEAVCRILRAIEDMYGMRGRLLAPARHIEPRLQKEKNNVDN